MRITNGMMINNMLGNLNNGLNRVNKYHNQLASNRRIVRLSDDPVGVLNSLGARTQIRRLQQYQRNVTYSQSWVKSTESAVTELQELFVSARELLTDAMGTETPADKKIFATQMRQTLENILEVCNTSIGDKYVFGGFNVTKQPFTAERDENGNITNVLYNGLDLSGKNMVVSNGGVVADNSLGDSLLDQYGVDTLTWKGDMDIRGAYTISGPVREPVDPEDKDMNGATRHYLLFTDKNDTSTPPKSYKAYLSDMPTVEKENQRITLDLKTEDGQSFGRVSWVQATIPDAEHPMISDAEIMRALSTRGEIESTSETNDDAVMGPKADSRLTKWDANIKDPKEKYTIEADGATLRFYNSKGSLVGSHTISDQELASSKQTNGTYRIDLTEVGPDLNLGFVTIDPRESNPVMDLAATAEKMGLRDESEAAAYIISTAGFVTSKIGEEATQNIQFEVGHQVLLDVTYTGIELAGLGDSNCFSMMIDICDELDAGVGNEKLTRWLTPLIQTQDRLLTSVVKAGNRTLKLETLDSRYKLDAIDYEATRSDIEDIDQALVITQMKYAEMIYKQALASGAQIIQPTLMDYLR